MDIFRKIEEVDKEIETSIKEEKDENSLQDKVFIGRMNTAFQVKPKYDEKLKRWIIKHDKDNETLLGEFYKFMG